MLHRRWRNVEFVVKRVKAAKYNFILGEVDDVMQVGSVLASTIVVGVVPCSTQKTLLSRHTERVVCMLCTEHTHCHEC